MEICGNVRLRIPKLNWSIDAELLKPHYHNWGHGHILPDIVSGVYADRENIEIRILLTQIPLRISGKQSLTIEVQLEKISTPTQEERFVVYLIPEEDQIHTVELLQIEHIEIEEYIAEGIIRVRFNDKHCPVTKNKFEAVVYPSKAFLISHAQTLAVA